MIIGDIGIFEINWISLILLDEKKIDENGDYMYKIKEKKMTPQMFINECIERAFYNATVPIDLPHYKFIIFDEKRYAKSGKMFSEIAIKEIGREYNKKIHIVKHVYQPENEIFYEEDITLNYHQLLALQNMDTILKQKSKANLQLIK